MVVVVVICNHLHLYYERSVLKPIVPDPGTCICVLTDTTGNYFTPRVR